LWLIQQHMRERHLRIVCLEFIPGQPPGSRHQGRSFVNNKNNDCHKHYQEHDYDILPVIRWFMKSHMSPPAPVLESSFINNVNSWWD